MGGETRNGIKNTTGERMVKLLVKQKENKSVVRRTMRRKEWNKGKKGKMSKENKSVQRGSKRS